MDIILSDKSKFNVEGFLNSQGKTVVGTTPQQWFNMLPGMERGKMNIRIKDMQTDEEEEFDIGGFLKSKGYEVDFNETFTAQQEQAKLARKKSRIEENIKQAEAIKETFKEKGSAQAFMQTYLPFSWARYQNEKAGRTKPSNLKDLWAVTMDVVGGLVRTPIAALEEGLHEVTGGQHGRPFYVSMSRMADYGADTDPETGEEETLGEHMKVLQEAMRVDPQGVLTDLAVESGRDPLTGLHLVSGSFSGGLTPALAASLKGTKTARVIINLAKKYKKITAPAVATAKYVEKANEKLNKLGVAKKFASALMMEGVEGGVQGVFTNYVIGSNKDAWNTFVIEGVEEAIFGAGMFLTSTGASTAMSRAWGGLKKEEQINATHNVRAKAQKLAQLGIAPTPENLFNEVNVSPPPPEVLALGPQTQVQAILAKEQQALQSTPITQALPPSERTAAIKKIMNPLHESPAEKAVRIETDETKRKVRKDLGKIKTTLQNAEDATRADLEKISEDITKEIVEEDIQEDERRKKNEEALQKDISIATDPTRPTSFDAWDRLMGGGMTVEEKADAYLDFRTNEQKGIDQANERISPTEKKEEESPEPIEPSMREEPADIEIHPEQQLKKTDVDPWAVTKEEYLKEYPGKAGELAHQEIVQKAVSAGKPIPPEVMADYGGMAPALFNPARKPVFQSEDVKKNVSNLFEPEDVGLADVTPRGVEAPVMAPKADAERKFINIVDESKLNEVRDRIRQKLMPGRLYSNPMFDPELWTDMVYLGMIHAQRGINNFVDWSREVTNDLGDAVKPYLRSVYSALQAYPRNVKFDPEVAVQLFEFGGITRQELGPDRGNIENALVETYGERAAELTDFIHQGLEFYPTIEQIQGLNYESDEAEVVAQQPGIVGEGGEAGGQETPEGLPPGAENRVDIRPSDADVPGEPNPSSLDYGEGEGEIGNEPQKAISQDVYVRQNMDLRNLPPVEMGPAARRKTNLQAAEILERVKTDPASLTQDDRLILRQYTGQGGLDVTQLTADEMAGTLNQHYTSYQIANATWRIIESMGFNLMGAEALEPTAGVGNFAGTAPREVKWRMNEVDETAGEIMNLLYPESENSIAPFETYTGPLKDLVISNVPFLEHRGKYSARESDAKYKNIKSLHNYVMMKSVDQLRDNGLAVFITSTWTMDGKNKEFRKQLNQKAEVLAAIRIPMGAFQKNTQYAGSADLIILRKRTTSEMQQESAEERIQDDFVDTIPVMAPQADGISKPTTRSKWFETHRSQALGEWKYGTSKGGLASSTYLNVEKNLFDNALEDQMISVADELSGRYVPEAGAALPSDMVGVGEDLGQASDNTPKFGLEDKDGIIAKSDQYGRLRRLRPETFQMRRGARNVEMTDWSRRSLSDKHLAIIIRLMETARQLRDGIAEGVEVKHLQDRAKRLLVEYQSLPKYHKQPMIKKDGKEIKLFPGVTEKRVVVETPSGKPVRKTVGLQFQHNPLVAYAGLDNRYWLLRSLYNKELNGFSTLLTKKPKVNVAPEPPKGDMKTAKGVVDYVMNKYGVFRMVDAQQAWEGDPDSFRNEMLSHPNLNWNGEEFIHDRDFIVGNLRDKIAYAEKMGLKNQLNKLKAALPEQATLQTLDMNPVSTWWDYEALTAFGHDSRILGQGQRIERYQEGLKTRFRVISGTGENIRTHTYQDREDPLYLFVEVVLNQRNAMMPDPLDLGDKPKLIKDFKTTVNVRKKFQKSFRQWGSRPNNPHAARAVENYNKNFASRAAEDYSTEAMFIKGIATEINGRPFTPFPAQLSSVRLYMNQGGGILAHDVGNGKTLAAIFCYAHAKQVGKVKKGLFCVPAGTVGMWEENFMLTMPGIKTKVIHSEPAAVRRSDFMDAVANNYDIVIVPHHTMKTLPLRKSNVYIEEEINALRPIMEALARQEEESAGGKRRKIKAQLKSIEKRLARLQGRMEQNYQAEKDMLGGVFYEDLGADMLVVDEAHNHKNTFEHTNEYAEKQFLKLGGKSSHMADDLQHKTRHTHEINNRGGVLFLTATPTPNNIIEIYSMIKFVAPWEWEQRGIKTVDDFVRNFVDLGPLNQATLSGTSADKEGVLGYKNGKALHDIVRAWVDYKEATPESQIGRPETEEVTRIVEPNDEQLNMMGEIAVLDAMDYKQLLQMGVNPVTLTTRAKALAIDPAFENPALVDEFPSFYDRSPRLKQVMDDVKKEFENYPDRVSLIFLEQYNVYDWRPITDDGGNKIPWPSGFGKVEIDAEEEAHPPSWMAELTPAQKSAVSDLIAAPIIPDQWPARFVDGKGIPKTFTKDNIEKVRPLIDEETGTIYLSEKYVRQNLHQEMKRYAINELGMDPDRVFVVNGSSNNKPADKTRIETLNYLEKMTLCIGNSVMSEGLNLQTKGRAIFRVDVPWEPKTVTQSNGRMLRPRYDLDDTVPVALYKYALRYSADRKLYEILDRKREWNRDLIYGDWDYQDNSINNDSAVGIKNLSEELSVPPHIVEGFKMKFKISQDGVRLTAARKEARKMAQAVERARNNFAEATRKVEDSREKIKAGIEKHEQKVKEIMEYNQAHPDKPKELPPAYDATHWEDVIRRNTPAMESGQQFIDEALEAYKPYEKIDHDYEVNQLAQNVLRDVHKNQWASISSQITDAETLNTYQEFLKKTIPDLFGAYPKLADMLAAKVLKQIPADPESAANQIYQYIADNYSTTGQEGFGTLGAMMAIVGTPLAILFPKTAVSIAGGAALFYAFRRAWRSNLGKQNAWSLWARLREQPGFGNLEPLIHQTMTEQQMQVAREEDEFKRAIKGLSQEELLRVADKIEDDSIIETQAVSQAAQKMQRLFLRVAIEAQRAGIPITTDVNYYPRMLDFDRIQAMKSDPDLLQQQANHLVSSGQGSDIFDAYGILLNFFDNSAEMRGERRRQETAKIMQAILQRNPRITPQAFMKIYLRMKQKYGVQIIGNLKYGRVAPKLTNDMYHRDPREVMAKYLPGAWNTIIQKRILGNGNNNAINQFLNANYPVLDQVNPERDEVSMWFRKQLEGGAFPGTGPSAMKWSKRARAYQFWTKLVTSHLAPAKNIAGAFNLALPLAGGRATVEGLIKGLADVRSGFRPARVAGAISNRMIAEIYGVGEQIDKTSFQKLKRGIKEWNLFGISEKFVRSFAFHAGRNMAERLHHQAMENGDANSYKKLYDVLGQARMTRAALNGMLESSDLDLFGVFMANKIGGTTNAFDLARWMNTPEGRLIMQFHSMAMTQTRTFKDEILMPAFRKHNRDVGPLMRWGLAVGMSLPAIVALQAGIYNFFGADPPEREEPNNPFHWAWNAAMLSNMVFALGMYGDVAAGLDTPEGVTPLVGTVAGPTLNTILSSVRDFIYFAQGQEERPKRTIRREVPGINFLTKVGALPVLEE